MPTCDAVTDAFIRETGRINESELFRRNVRQRPINDLQMGTRGTWTDGAGVALSNLTQARNFPLAPASSRTNVANSDGASTDACLPPVITLADGSITQAYQLRHLAEQTKEYCINDIRSSTQFAKIWAGRKKQLAEISAWTWADWFTLDYTTLAAHHITQQTTGAFDNGVSGYSVSKPPTAGLSFGVLETISNSIFREGEVPMSRDMDTGGGVSTLIIGESQSRNLLRNNPNLEQQIRWAWMGAKDESPLLPSGRERKRRSFGGFVHEIDPYPRRFDIVGGAYVQRQPFTSVNVTKGTNQDLSDAYKYARYEEVIMWNPGVYRSLVPKPLNIADFNPVNYMGDFSVRNILDKDCNPDGNKLFWRAIYSDAAEPLNPNLGYCFLVLNCGFDQSGPSCTPATSSSSA